jgi:Fur family transcriptional regulator, ferric uptake regulator
MPRRPDTSGTVGIRRALSARSRTDRRFGRAVVGRPERRLHDRTHRPSPATTGEVRAPASRLVSGFVPVCRPGAPGGGRLRRAHDRVRAGPARPRRGRAARFPGSPMGGDGDDGWSGWAGAGRADGRRVGVVDEAPVLGARPAAGRGGGAGYRGGVPAPAPDGLPAGPGAPDRSTRANAAGVGAGGGVHEAVDAALRAVSQRYTASRRTLVSVLVDAAQPLAIPDIVAARPELPQSSVYRNLAELERAGVVRRIVTTGEFACYELAEDLTEHHHHLICSVCGSVSDFTVAPRLERELATALAQAARDRDFRIQAHRLDLVGVCAGCS